MQNLITIKSKREIELMRAAGKIVNQVLSRLQDMTTPGITTMELNIEAEKIITDAGGIALFKGIEHPQTKIPFPASVCISVNEEIVHGIPSNRVLKDEDIVSIDCGVKLNGYCADSAITVPVGKISEEVENLINVTKAALDMAVEDIFPGKRWSEIASRMQKYVEGCGFSVIRDFVGHGIGRKLHELPKVTNYWNEQCMDFVLTPGLVIAIEPMIAQGTYETKMIGESKWVAVTCDGKLSAHFEHTVAVTENGFDVLTIG